jgi:hypothetical protein
MSVQLPPGPARGALLGALEAVGSYQAGYDAGEMPELDHRAVVALAGVASVALDRLRDAGGDPEELMLQLYAVAHGIPVASS